MTAKLLFHLSVVLVYLYSLSYDIFHIGDEYDPYIGYLLSYKGYGGKFKFMTFINCLLQATFFAVTLYRDIWDVYSKHSDFPKKPARGEQRRHRIQSILDKFFTCVCYPLGAFTVITFWSIYAVDRELIFPRSLDGVIPAWINHSMHTVPLPVLLVEKWLVYHPYPSRPRGFSILLSVAATYLIWICWVAYMSDYWVYPVLAVLEAHQKAIFIAVLMSFICSIYLLGESINNFIWRKQLRSEKKKKK